MIPALQSLRQPYRPLVVHPCNANVGCNSRSAMAFSGRFSDSDKLLKKIRQLKQIKDLEKMTEFIGCGHEGFVYKLKNLDFCVKIPRGMLLFGNWSRRIIDEQRVNHIVAVSSGGATAMKYIAGKPLHFKGDELYALPEKSFRAFIKQISEAKEKNMLFDACSGNVIFNPQNQTITAIDFRRARKLNPFNFSCKTFVFSDVYYALKRFDRKTERRQKNTILVGKLLNVALNEIKSGRKPAFKIEKEDIFDMLNNYKDSQQNLPKNYDKLTQLIGEIIDEQALAKDAVLKQQFGEKIAAARAIIDKEFICPNL